MERLCDVLEVRRGVTAVIGGGGKTSLLYRLASELRERGMVLVARRRGSCRRRICPSVMTGRGRCAPCAQTVSPAQGRPPRAASSRSRPLRTG